MSTLTGGRTGAATDSIGSRHLVLFVVATAFYWMSMYLYMPILSVHIEKNLGASMGLVGTILGAYGLGQLLVRLPLGMWSDRLGRRKPFILAGIACSGIGALGMGLTSDPGWMVVWRGMTGVGAAAWVAFTVLFASYFPSDKATRALSIASFTSSTSMMLGSLAGGMIAERWGWYPPFFLAAALALIGFLAAAPMMEKAVPPRQGVNLAHMFRVCTVPLLLAVSSIAALSTWTIWVTVYGFTPVYAAQMGVSRGDLGVLATAAQATGAIATLGSAFLSERIGARSTLVAAIIIQAAGAVMVPFVQSMPLLVASQVLGGGGRALLYPLCMGLSIKAVAPHDRATAMGVFQAVYALGMFAGPQTTGFFGDAFGISSVFFIAGGIALLGIPIVLTKVQAK